MHAQVVVFVTIESHHGMEPLVKTLRLRSIDTVHGAIIYTAKEATDGI